MTKPSLPQGTRDFGPEVVRKRQFILNTIKNVFELYGFQPLETPAMENLETLMGKYGEEGDKLIFKILNNGLDHPAKEKQAREGFEKILQGKNTKDITERALRYDLTIPFARYVAMNHAQISFPFKRYQMQPVWRADRPQKGRYREFYQCDADIVGSTALINEVELAGIYHDAFTLLGIEGYELHINSRNILAALAEKCGSQEKMMAITMAIDKLDKIGIEKVKQELVQKGIGEDQARLIETYLDIQGSNKEKLDALREFFRDSELAVKGLEELTWVSETIAKQTNRNVRLKIDLTLARGLNYYTGLIFEVKAPAQVRIGSIGGGGRYDDLTGLFGVKDIAGVGISFGVDRIYDVMEELNLFPETVAQGTRVLFFNLGKEESAEGFRMLNLLRQKGIASEIYHEPAKFDKQFKYAERKNIPFIIIIGSKELEQKTCTVKDLRTGEQSAVPFEFLPDFLFI